MSIAITVRNVPDEVRNILAARAAASGRSLQEYLLRELIHTAMIPTSEEVVGRVRGQMASVGTQVSIEDIVAAIRADRDDPGR